MRSQIIPALAIYLELANKPRELIALLVEHMGSRRGFLGHGGILLGHLVHMTDLRIDLMQRIRLLLRAVRYA
jgi:hypothetical protein